MLIEGLIERAGSDFTLTDRGRAGGADDAGGDEGARGLASGKAGRVRGDVSNRGLTVRPGRGTLTVKK
jgi:hypothetical protein